MDAGDDDKGYSSNSAAVAGLAEKAGADTFPNTTGSPGSARPPAELGDVDIRIARDGSWLYCGSPITRQPLVKLFASVLRREADGSYWLTTPVERGRIAVEDVPFVAVALDVAGEGSEQRLMLRTNLDEIVTAGPDHPLRVETAASGEPAPYIVVRDGIEARLSRPVFYELVELGTGQQIAGETLFGVWSQGVFFPLGDPGPDWR